MSTTAMVVDSLTYVACLLRLAHFPDHDIGSHRTGHRTVYQQKIFVRIHFHDAQVLYRQAAVAHMSREMLSRPDTRGKRTAANAAWRAMMHGAVRGIASAEVPPFYGAGKALALGDAGHVHEFPGLEAIDQHAVAGLGIIGGIIEANFAQAAHGRDIGLLEVSHHGLGDALRLDEFHKSELRGIVAVFFLGAPLHHNAGPGLQHRAPNRGAIFGEDLGHAQLDSEYSVDSHESYPSLQVAQASACTILILVIRDSTQAEACATLTLPRALARRP